MSGTGDIFSQIILELEFNIAEAIKKFLSNSEVYLHTIGRMTIFVPIIHEAKFLLKRPECFFVIFTNSKEPAAEFVLRKVGDDIISNIAKHTYDSAVESLYNEFEKLVKKNLIYDDEIKNYMESINNMYNTERKRRLLNKVMALLKSQ